MQVVQDARSPQRLNAKAANDDERAKVLRRAPHHFICSQDIVRTAWRHAETSRNVLSIKLIILHFLHSEFLWKLGFGNWKLQFCSNKIVDTLVVHALNDAD